jgi:hypothetical protein
LASAGAEPKNEKQLRHLLSDSGVQVIIPELQDAPRIIFSLKPPRWRNLNVKFSRRITATYLVKSGKKAIYRYFGGFLGLGLALYLALS